MLFKLIFIGTIGIILIINLGIAYGTPGNYFHKSGTSQLKSYINKEVKHNDLIVFDSRIYTARSFWLATDKHFTLLNSFPQFYQINEKSSNKIPTNIYLIFPRQEIYLYQEL